MKKRTAWFLVAGVAAVSIGAASVGVVAVLLRSQKAGWSTSNYLYLSLDGDIPEQQPRSDFDAFFEKRPPSLRALVESLDRAAEDPKIAGVLIRVGVLPDVGWGKVQELRDAILRFRSRSNKPTYAHVEFCGNKEYYLATACSKIYAVPTALLDVSGLAAEVTFFQGTLAKLGIEAQFEGVGKYKNAPNQFTESGFTTPHREQMDALLDSLFSQYVTAISSGRHKSTEEVQDLIDSGPYEAKEALRAGLVDELLYQDQVDARFKDISRTSPGRYLRSLKGFGLGSRRRLAIIYAVGEIVPGQSQGSALGGNLAGSDTVAGALRRARGDDSVKGVVLRVDSPGGSGTASDVIWREVRLTAKAKPLIVSMGDVAASGGYYIAMGGDTIIAQPGTITGSIGVFGGKFSLKGLYDKLGLTKEILTRGERAALFSEYRRWSDEDRAKIRSMMVEFYQDFVGKVAQARRRSPADIDAVAQGRVWTGADALKHGLVDRLGGLEVALLVAKQKAGFGKDEDVDIVVFPERKGFFETLMERQEEGVLERSLPLDVRRLALWVRYLGDGAPMARLPFELRVR